jgi:hypothetical protein
MFKLQLHDLQTKYAFHSQAAAEAEAAVRVRGILLAGNWQESGVAE